MAPFLSGASGDPALIRRQIGQQTERDIPAPAGLLRDFRHNGGPIRIEQGVITRAVIDPSGEPMEDLRGKRGIGEMQIAIGDVDPANMGLLQCLLNLIGSYDYVQDDVSAPTWARWILHKRGETDAAPYLTVLEDTDALPRTRVSNIMVREVTIGATPNGNYLATFVLDAGRYDFLGVPTQAVGTGSTLPIFHETYEGNWADDDTDADVLVKLLSVASGVWTAVAKISSAAGYSATRTFTVTVGNDSAGNPIFARVPDGSTFAVSSITRSASTATVTTTAPHGYAVAETFRVLIAGAAQSDYNVSAVATATGASTFTYTVANAPVTPATGTITYELPGTLIGPWGGQLRMHLPEGGTWSANDVFELPKRREAAELPAFIHEAPISSVNTRIRLGGEEIRFEGGVQLKIARPVSNRPDTPGVQGATISRGGMLTASLTLTRDVVDLRLQKAIHERTPMAIDLDSQADVLIGASGRRYRLLFVAPSAIPQGPMLAAGVGAVTGPYTEAPVLMPKIPDETYTYTDDGGNIEFDGAFVLVLETDLLEDDVTDEVVAT